jgi:hypothetical protein
MSRKPFVILGALAAVLLLAVFVASCVQPPLPTPVPSSAMPGSGRGVFRDMATPTPANEVRFCAGGCPNYQATPGCVGGDGITSGSTNDPGSNTVYACVYGNQPEGFDWSCYAHAEGYGAVTQCYPQVGTIDENYSTFCSPFYISHQTWDVAMAVQTGNDLPYVYYWTEGAYKRSQSFTCGANGNWPPTGDCARVQHYEWSLSDTGANPATDTPTPTNSPTPTITPTSPWASNMLVEVYPAQAGATINPNKRGGIGTNDTYFKLRCLAGCPLDVTGYNLIFTAPSAYTFTLPSITRIYTDLYIFMDDAKPGGSIAIPGQALLVNTAATPVGYCLWSDPGVDMAWDCGNPLLGTPGAPATPTIQ